MDNEQFVHIFFNQEPNRCQKDHLLVEEKKDQQGRWVGRIELPRLMLYGSKIPGVGVVEVAASNVRAHGEVEMGYFKRGRCMVYVNEDRMVSVTSTSIQTFLCTWAKIINKKLAHRRYFPRP